MMPLSATTLCRSGTGADRAPQVPTADQASDSIECHQFMHVDRQRGPAHPRRLHADAQATVRAGEAQCATDGD